MRALTWHGKRDVRVDTVPDPVVRDRDDVIVKITTTGLCGSDLHLYEVLGAFLDTGDILGHEPMGIVQEVGPDVTALKPGDRVVMPAMTFVATPNAVSYCGAEPVFADISGELEPWLSAEAAEAAIDERTRAIFAVCYGGHPGEIEALRALAESRGLALLEDAAHGCAARQRGRHLGTFGRIGSFSFSASAS